MRSNNYLLVFFILLTSCSSDAEKAIDGFWAIESIDFKGTNLLFNLNGNMIEFKDGNVKTPLISPFTERVMMLKQDGTFRINENNNLNIDIENEVFEGRHNIYFENDNKKKRLLIHIESDKLKIIASKFLFDYNAERSLVKNLTGE